MPRRREQDNPIDKAFTVMAEMIVKMIPIDSQQKKAYVYYRDGLSAQNDGDYSEALENYEESLRLEENPIDRSETLKNMYRKKICVPSRSTFAHRLFHRNSIFVAI